MCFSLEDISNYFLNRTPITQEIRARIDKWDCIKLKSFCTAKETITRMKRQAYRMGQNFCKLFIKGLISRIHRAQKK
jgi:hypothetical protein